MLQILDVTIRSVAHYMCYYLSRDGFTRINSGHRKWQERVEFAMENQITIIKDSYCKERSALWCRHRWLMASYKLLILSNFKLLSKLWARFPRNTNFQDDGHDNCFIVRSGNLIFSIKHFLMVMKNSKTLFQFILTNWIILTGCVSAKKMFNAYAHSRYTFSIFNR